MGPERVKVGIVGVGLVFTSHLKGYLSHPNAEVLAVCDLDGDRARQFAEKYKIPQVYSSFEEMLQKADINTVDIATPTFLHVPMTLQAAEAGNDLCSGADGEHRDVEDPRAG